MSEKAHRTLLYATQALLLICFLSLIYPRGEAEASYRERVINKSYLSTQHIQVVSDTGQMVGSCSGTAVSENVILTATHCLYRMDVIGINGEVVKVNKIVSDGFDSSLVSVDKPFKHYSTMNLDYKHGIGEEVFIIGNPGRMLRMYRQGTYAGTSVEDTPLGVVMEIDLFNLNIFPGDSGSAIFNKDGEIINVVNALVWQDHPAIRWYMMSSYGSRFTKSQLKEVGL